MGLKLGFNAKAYFLSTGTRTTWAATIVNGAHSGAAPSDLTEMGDIKDISIPIEKTEADVTTRGSGGWEMVKGTIKKTGFDIPMIWDAADTGVAALMKAFLTEITIALAFLDGDKATVGVRGIWADFEVLKMEKGEEIAGVQMVTFNVKPGYSAVPPEVVVVAAGS